MIVHVSNLFLDDGESDSDTLESTRLFCQQSYCSSPFFTLLFVLTFHFSQLLHSPSFGKPLLRMPPQSSVLQTTKEFEEKMKKYLKSGNHAAPLVARMPDASFFVVRSIRSCYLFLFFCHLI